MKRKFKVGDVIPTSVNREHIDDSDPCNKDNCMLTRAFCALLVAAFGGKASDYHVKSTNHGLTFQLGSRRYVCVFDNKTGRTIYSYDQLYRTKHSKEAAQASVKPFKARVMVESSTQAIVWPKMSDETKKKLRAMPRKKDGPYKPRTTGSRRELSL